MDKRFTFYARTLACVLTFGALAINSFTVKTYGQNTCADSRLLFSETFGNGTTATGNADILPTGLTYQATGSLANEGIYRVINSTQQKPEWHASADHTPGDINGKALVVNGQAETFYRHRVDTTGRFVAGDYTANLFIMNVNTPGTCAPDPLLTDITLRVEYLSETNTWVPLSGSPFVSGPLAQTIDATWVGIGATFNLPTTGAFLVKSMRIVLSDGTAGGCGNDFALDDITLSQCTGGAPTPVTFLNINAHQKGSGVNIEWSTSQELNSKSFAVEKSANGNSNWSVIASANGAGNSSTVKNYKATDPHPFKGTNFYRVKQVDVDGHFSYSKTVSVKLTAKTGVSVVANPFTSVLTLDFSSSTAQVISATLHDITGKQVGAENWTISSGSTKKEFSNAGRLQPGIYILTVSNTNGEILYNNKVIRQ